MTTSTQFVNWNIRSKRLSIYMSRLTHKEKWFSVRKEAISFHNCLEHFMCIIAKPYNKLKKTVLTGSPNGAKHWIVDMAVTHIIICTLFGINAPEGANKTLSTINSIHIYLSHILLWYIGGNFWGPLDINTGLFSLPSVHIHLSVCPVRTFISEQTRISGDWHKLHLGV